MSEGRPATAGVLGLGAALVGLVVASGLGGVLLAKRHFADAGPAVPGTASRAPATAATASVAPLGAARIGRPGASAEKGLDGTPAQPAPVTQGVVLPDTPEEEAHSPGYVTEDREIGLVLGRWQRALLANDPSQAAQSYAPVVDRYFLKTHVDRGFVRASMLVQQARGITLKTYELRDLSIAHADQEDVDVHFLASFTVDTPEGEKTGQARTELKLHREEGDWKIVYERDFRG